MSLNESEDNEVGSVTSSEQGRFGMATVIARELQSIWASRAGDILLPESVAGLVGSVQPWDIPLPESVAGSAGSVQPWDIPLPESVAGLDSQSLLDKSEDRPEINR
jgi:hypothetical protein